MCLSNAYSGKKFCFIYYKKNEFKMNFVYIYKTNNCLHNHLLIQYSIHNCFRDFVIKNFFMKYSFLTLVTITSFIVCQAQLPQFAVVRPNGTTYICHGIVLKIKLLMAIIFICPAQKFQVQFL